jgi:HK97 family phage portal protein
VSLFARRSAGPSLRDLGVPSRLTRNYARSPAEARRVSAVWACLRLRGDLISSMPVDVYRRVGDVLVEVPKPPVLITPGGRRWKLQPWIYASQNSLDGIGNSVGLITARDGLGLPAVVELQDMAKVTYCQRANRPDEWRIDGAYYDLDDVWHERQYELSGSPLGLSPIAHAAFTLEKYTSAQEFAREWFDGKALPAAVLRNTEQQVVKGKAIEIKDQYNATVRNGGLFVTGKDWEYNPISAQLSDANYLNSMQADLVDVCRFLGCPADVIDVMVSGQNVTYATISQRNLQLLVHNLAAPVRRREDALSDLTPRPRLVKLNSDAILRMDPETRSRVLGQQVKDRILAPSEARGLQNLPPYTDDQLAEFDRLFGRPTQAPATAQTGIPT